MEKLPEGINSIKTETFRSGGKGGQNVNKVETAVRLRARISDQKVLKRLRELFPNSVTQEGEFLVSCQEERSQKQNKLRAMEILRKKLNAAKHKPKKRLKTTPTRASKEKRLKEKKVISAKKQERQKIKPWKF